MPESTSNSECVVVTGATGFLGKVVLEELLRTRRNAEVIVIVRAKGKRTADDRLKQLQESACFADLKPEEFNRVTAVEGDLATTGCGLSREDSEKITARATRVIHCAASIDFDLRIEEAAQANIDATLNVMELARACERLVSVVSVSTAYVTPNPHGTPITEELAPLPWNPEELYERIHGGNTTSEELTGVTGHPNSYTLTKCLAEHLIAKRFSDLPITIVRPSIISACQQYPRPGWLDSRAAFAAFVALIGSGHLRAIVAKRKTVMDVVPCDVVAMHILQELFSKTDGSGDGAGDNPGDGPAGEPVRIRHSVTGIDNGPTVAQARDEILGFFRAYPVEQPPRLRYIGPANWVFTIADYFEHTRGLGSKRIPMSPARAKFIRKQVQYVNRAFRYFTLNSFDFRTSLEWPLERRHPRAYLRTICEGVYRHLLRGKPESLLIAGRRFGRLYREISHDATDRNVLRRLGRELGRRTDALTVDEEALSRIRSGSDGENLVVFRPGGGLSSAETALLCTYTLLVRPHIGFSPLWIIPGKQLPTEIASILKESGQGDSEFDAPVAIAATADAEDTPTVLMRDTESLRRRLASARDVLSATVRVSLDDNGQSAPSGKEEDSPVVLAPESGLAGLRNGASGPKLLSRATRDLATGSASVESIHLTFEGSE